MLQKTSTFNKTIICVTGPQNTGKTQTLKKLANKLREKFGAPKSLMIQRKEVPENIIDVFELPTEMKIGVASSGDPHPNPQNDGNELGKLVAEGCDIIFCAARDPASTVTPPDRVSKAVWRIAKVNGYDIIWVSHLYYMKGSRKGLDCFHDLCHERNADFLLQLMEELLLEQVLFKP